MAPGAPPAAGAAHGLEIGILARSLATFRGGVDDYVEAILRHGTIRARERGHRVRAYVDDGAVAERLRSGGCEAVVVRRGLTGLLGWDHVRSMRRAKADALDVLICPRSFRPLHAPCPTITIVYDLMYFDAALAGNDHGAYFRGLHRLTLHRSDAVAVFSDFTRARLLANLPRVRAERVERLDPGPPDGAFRRLPANEVASTLARLGVTHPYALVVGMHPRKNVETVLQALARGPGDLGLVVVAPRRDPARIRVLEALAADAGLRGRVRLLPSVRRDELAALYNGAFAAVYVPSYEGIGIPPLEAMACACPVIASAAGSIPEVVGDAALQVPAGDADALARALAALAREPGRADALRIAGEERVRRLDWKKTASDLIEMAERVALRGRSGTDDRDAP